MALGELIGTGLGIGASLLFPPLAPFAPAIGATVGGAIESGIKNKKANEMDLPLVDPTQTAYLETLKQRRKNLETGAAYQSQQDLIKQTGAKAQGNILKLAGGDVGTAVANTLAVNRSTGKNMNELFGEMSIEGLKLDAMIGDLVNTIASRKLGIQSYKQQQAKLEAAQQQQDAMRNLYALSSEGGGWMKDLFSKVGSGANYGVNPISTIGEDNSITGTPIDLTPSTSAWNWSGNF